MEILTFPKKCSVFVNEMTSSKLHHFSRPFAHKNYATNDKNYMSLFDGRTARQYMDESLPQQLLLFCVRFYCLSESEYVRPLLWSQYICSVLLVVSCCSVPPYCLHPFYFSTCVLKLSSLVM